MCRLLLLSIGIGLFAQEVRIRILPEEYNFGTVTQGTLVKARFSIRNEGTKPVAIQDIKPSCSCSVTSWERREIAPGDSLPVQVSFNTAGKIGRQRKSFTILSSAANSPAFFYLVGEVQAPSLYDPANPD
jgi:uncharacterized protein (DUF58 family)